MTRERGILNFVKSHFKNSIKAILHISTKLKQFHLKAFEHCTLNNLTNIHVMTFNVHLAQLDVAPTRNLIISKCKIEKYVTTCDKDGGGVKNIMKFV
jgi:hypothetical protein